jgi:hypothetical protein
MQILVTGRSVISIGARHFIEQPIAFIAVSLEAFAKLSKLGDCGVSPRDIANCALLTGKNTSYSDYMPG